MVGTTTKLVGITNGRNDNLDFEYEVIKRLSLRPF